MKISCPKCHGVLTVWFDRHHLSQQEVFKIRCTSCDQWFYKCKICYNFQRSASIEVCPKESNGRKKRTASCFTTFVTGTKNNFCNKHVKTAYHKAVCNHVFSRNSSPPTMNTNFSSTESTTDQGSTINDQDDSIISRCELPDDNSNMSDSSTVNMSDTTTDNHTGNEYAITGNSAFNSMIEFQKMIQGFPQPVDELVHNSFPMSNGFYEATRNNAAGQYIVNCAIHEDKSNSYLLKPISDTLFYVLLTNLLKNLNKSDRQVLCSLLQYLQRNPASLRIPKNISDARKFYVEGKNSLHKQLPQPNVSNVGNGYCTLTFNEVIRHAFCSNRPPLPFLSLPGSIYSNTPRGNELLQSDPIINFTKCSFPHYPVKLILWSDGFKSLQFNENSIHCMLSTIGSLEGDQRGRGTHPMWIGPSKNSFEFAAMKIVHELNHLQKGILPDRKPFVVYHHKWKRLVHVSTKVYAYLCDRPDKAKVTCTLQGGLYGNRYGFAGNLHQIMQDLVPCMNCYNRILHRKPVGKQWQTRCPNGCFAFDHDIAFYKADHNKYPKSLLEKTGPTLLPVKKISFQSLIRACIFAFESVLRDKWNQTNTIKYLKTEGVNTSVSTQLYNNALNMKKYKEVVLDPVNKVDPPVKLYYRDRYEQNPEDFEMPQLPALWYLENFDIHDFPAGLGHSLFLGIQKSLCVSTLWPFLLREKSLDYFSSIFNQKLDDLRKIVLPFINIEQNSGNQLSFGGWLCRHWVSFCRYSKWLLSHLQISISDFPDKNHNQMCNAKKKHKKYHKNSHFSDYTKQDIVDWCNDRNVSLDGVQLSPLVTLKEWFIRATDNPKLLFQNYSTNDILEYIEDNFP